MLGIRRFRSYSAGMTVFLRYVGILNAAVWFGGSLFFALGVLPAVFSPEVRELFQKSGYEYYAGGVALAVFHRYFMLHYFCGVVALLHLAAEKVYVGKAFNRFTWGLVLGLLSFSLIGGMWFQPHMEKLRHEKYFNPRPELREQARHSFAIWHGVSEGVNMIVLIGLLAHLIHNTRAVQPSNMRMHYQIPG